MVDLCREFGISRKTGYKIFDRYHPGLCRQAAGIKEVHDDIWLVTLMD
jgi:hypothetical protein